MVESSISQREALYLGDLLTQEAVCVEKLSVYANQVNDPQLRSLCTELVSAHLRNYDRIAQQVQSGGGFVAAGSQPGSAYGTATGYATGYPATHIGTQYAGGKSNVSGRMYSPGAGYSAHDTGATHGTRL